MISVQDVISMIPEWNKKSLHVSKLGRGITNENYRVEVENEGFVVRIPGRDTHYLGIDREREYECNRAASLTGIAPEVTHFFKRQGVIITRFIEGEPMNAEGMQHETAIRKAVQSIKKIHTGPPFPGIFSVFRTIENYLVVGRSFNVTLPADIDWMFDRVYKIEKILTRRGEMLRPCHNDLLAANFLNDGRKFWIIDWELAAMGDLYFDIGNFSANHLLSDDQDELIVNEYFGGVSSYRLSRLKLFKVLSDIREAMWAVVQMGISKLEVVDYQDYANKHFEKYRNSLKHPLYGRYIDQVTRYRADSQGGNKRS